MSRRATLIVGVLLVAFGGLLAGCGNSSEVQPGLGPLTSSGAGHRFYEVLDAVGPARGTMLMLHGGGWKDTRGDAQRMMAAASSTFRASGWRVLVISYSPGFKSREGSADPRPMLRDVVAFYDQARRAFGGPICAYGESAGGYLAAMLAIERPSLTCAILNAAPLDLRALLRHTVPAIASEIRLTFGLSPRVLDEWSPASRWNTAADRTAIFATAASNDATVPPGQLRAFTAKDPSADAEVVPGASPGSADAVPWMHSAVRRGPIELRGASVLRWLSRMARPTAAARLPLAASIGRDCDRLPDPSQRWKLMLAGDAWTQSSTAGGPIFASRGCSGSARWQDDGLSLWALPSPGAVLPAGAQASLILRGAGVLHRLSVAFRGFLARPQDWDVGLYASERTHGPIQARVAACERGQCSHLRLVGTNAGALITSSSSPGDPDRREQPPSAAFALPAGTRSLAWRLRCVAPEGCSLARVVSGNRLVSRPRDPLGHPAILSLYRVSLS